MPRSTRPRKKQNPRWRNTNLLFVKRKDVDEIHAIVRRIELAVEIKLPHGTCDIDDVQSMRDALNFATILIYAGHRFDENAFERENGDFWRKVIDAFHSYYGRATKKSIFVATGDELNALRDGFIMVGKIIHEQLEQEPVWCLKTFAYMKTLTDGKPGRIELDTTDLEKKVKRV